MSENIFEVRFRAGQPQRSPSFEWADENRSFIIFEKISIIVTCLRTGQNSNILGSKTPKYWIFEKKRIVSWLSKMMKSKIISRLDSEPDNPKEVVASNGQMKIEAL